MSHSFHCSSMSAYLRARERGLALPVMLIMLLVMVVTSVYLLRTTNSSTLAVSNMAYDAALSRAADLGLHTGFSWLKSTAADDTRVALNDNVANQGYVATMVPNQSPRDSAFWNGSIQIDGADNTRVEYVIHRMCSTIGAPSADNNRCLKTSAVDTAGSGGKIGESQAVDTPDYGDLPRVHYTITSRIPGVRGGNVVNQMVVMIGI